MVPKTRVPISNIFGNQYAKKVIRETFFLPKSLQEKYGSKVKHWRTLMFYGVSLLATGRREDHDTQLDRHNR